MKYALKALATRARSTAWAARTDGQDEGDGLRILFYHRVSDDRDELAVSPRDFRRQMDYLATESYRVVDVVEAAELLDEGASCRRTVGLSFDDGFLDVAEQALPLLAERGFRATVFVAPAVVDGWATLRLVPLAAACARLGRDRRPRPRGDAPLRGPLAHAPESPLAARRRGVGGDQRLEAHRSRSTSSVTSSRFPTLPGSSGLANVDSSPQPGSASRSRASPVSTRAAQTVSRCAGGRSTGATACSTSARSSAAATTRPCRSAGCIAAAATAWERAACELASSRE